MNRIAIDIVIIPPEEIMDKVIAINQKEAKRGNTWGVLGKDDFYPHISLAMGTIKKEDLTKIQRILTTILKNQKPLKVELVELYYALGSDGLKSYCLRMKRTKEIQKLHEELMNKLLPYFSYDATLEDLFKKDNEETKTPDYINKYSEQFSFGNFDPHLTLRCKEVEFNAFPIHFNVSTIAVCHAGTQTTCRKILFQIILK